MRSSVLLLLAIGTAWTQVAPVSPVGPDMQTVTVGRSGEPLRFPYVSPPPPVEYRIFGQADGAPSNAAPVIPSGTIYVSSSPFAAGQVHLTEAVSIPTVTPAKLNEQDLRRKYGARGLWFRFVPNFFLTMPDGTIVRQNPPQYIVTDGGILLEVQLVENTKRELQEREHQAYSRQREISQEQTAVDAAQMKVTALQHMVTRYAVQLSTEASTVTQADVDREQTRVNEMQVRVNDQQTLLNREMNALDQEARTIGRRTNNELEHLFKTAVAKGLAIRIN